MFSLPLELLFHVLEKEYYTSSGTPNYKHLKACALVCRSWSGPAQSLLFRSAIELSNHNIHTFHAALLSSAARGKALGNCVRTLALSISRTSDKSFGPMTVATLLQACPHVYELVLSLYGINIEEEETLEKLKVAGQRLKAFTLVHHGTQSPILFHLLRIWPNIQFLKVGSRIRTLPRCTTPSPPLERNTEDAGELRQRNGAEVCLYDLVISIFPAPKVLSWLLASSADSLRILELRQLPCLTERNILARHAPQLRLLRLWCYNDDSVALLRMCTALEELVLYGLEPSPCRPLVPNLPPTIEHFAFGIRDYHSCISLQPSISAVDAHPNLKVLTFNKDPRQRFQDCETLEAKCGMKGIEVVISSMPCWVYEEPIMVDRFPRARSVSNFTAMS
ncbi:hypothetical protein AZE42_04640 [Rhizopogon vesiculosus]|uniref:F-box domain-containing protein n=1 Tax=Rhizopogon vesiculosus TaxID=180088 RepID=A0A1J8PNT7_9AGAM|nr:hypothetical protein AZE42_04640 [Rhizopogon vesiculosus]